MDAYTAASASGLMSLTLGLAVTRGDVLVVSHSPFLTQPVPEIISRKTYGRCNLRGAHD